VLPGQRPAPHEVDVQMGHQLARVRPAVDGQAVATLKNAVLFGEFVGHPHHLPEERRIGVLHFCQRSDMLDWQDEDVHRRQRVDIREGKDFLVPVKYIGGYLPGGDLTENTVGIFINLPHPLNPPRWIGHNCLLGLIIV
jgi:hypothetical protein